MRIWKTWVLPILKGLVVVVIAGALIKLAFFPEQAASNTSVPTGSFADPTVAVEQGSIVNTLTVKGKVQTDKPTEGRVSFAGTVREVFVQVGSDVVYGQTIASIRHEKERAPVQNPDGTTTPRDPEVTWGELTAPATGKVTSLSLLSNQTVSVGEAGVQVTPSQLLVGGTIPPVQQYRLQTKPQTAQVTITGGPAPFSCTDLFIGQRSPSATAAPAPAAPGGGEAAPADSTPVSCRIPTDVAAFAGVEATMAIEGGRVDNVLTIPITAVKGQAGTGVVTVVGADGAKSERNVTLGLSDGTRVEVTSGLAAGDQILEFVPGQPRPTQSDCLPDPATGECAGGGGLGDGGAGEGGSGGEEMQP